MTSGIKGSITHGLRATYTHGCRCESCRKAHTEQLRADRATRYEATRLGRLPSTVTHGRASTYANWGCRCRPCTDASLVKNKPYKRAYLERRRAAGEKAR